MIRVRFIVLPMVVLHTWYSMAQSTADSVLLAKADTLRVHQEWKAAKKIYDGLIKRGSWKVHALVGRSKCNAGLGETREVSMADLNEALRIDSAFLPAIRYRALQFGWNKMYDRSIADLNDYLTLASDTSDITWAHVERSIMLGRVHKYKDAEQAALRSLSVDSTYCPAYNQLALIMDDLGRPEDTFTWLRRYIACDTTESTGYANMGFFLGLRERWSESLEWFDKAEALEPEEDALLLNNRGYSKLRTGDTDGAMKDINRSLQLKPTNSYAWRNLALVHFERQETDKGCDCLETALANGFTDLYGKEVKQLWAERCH